MTNLHSKLLELSADSTSVLVQSILVELEDGIGTLKECLGKIKRSNITHSLIVSLESDLLELETKLSEWRTEYPNFSPIRIDNRALTFALDIRIEITNYIARKGIY